MMIDAGFPATRFLPYIILENEYSRSKSTPLLAVAPPATPCSDVTFNQKAKTIARRAKEALNPFKNQSTNQPTN